MLLRYMGLSLGLGILLLIAYGILEWLHIPSGTLVDWLIGIATFWWLLLIVTVPWNVYFDAKELIAEAAISEEKDITVDAKQVKYAQKVQSWALIIAIALHLISAIALYILAATGISAIGYLSSVATLLLTALRPALRAYQYLVARLNMIREQIKYPREDVLELRGRFRNLETIVANIEKQLDSEQPDSLAASVERNREEYYQQIARVRKLLEELQISNETEHERLSREAKNAIAQLTEDSQFLSNVREIIRFFKEA